MLKQAEFDKTVFDQDAHLKEQLSKIALLGLSSDANKPNLRLDAETAFVDLYDATVHRVYALVRRFVRDEGLAEEVTADVFHQAWAQAGRFDQARGNVLAWLLIMARSRSLDACRRQSAQRISFDSELTDAILSEQSHHHSPLDILLSVDTTNALHDALEKIAPTARQMIGFAFFHGLTHSEISIRMQMPLGTVKTVIRRALHDLRDYLKDLVGAGEGCIELLSSELGVDDTLTNKSGLHHE
jgi:RNA polymerase sigma factor (sigma-70 family)